MHKLENRNHFQPCQKCFNALTKHDGREGGHAAKFRFKLEDAP